MLQRALAGKGIAVIPAGGKFLLVVPEAEVASVRPRISAPMTPPGKVTSPDLIPAGQIYFPNTDLSQVAQVYMSLIGRKLDQTQPLPQTTLPIKFGNQTPLTREECLYALDALFSWQGLKIVPVGHGSARLVPISDTGERSARSVVRP